MKIVKVKKGEWRIYWPDLGIVVTIFADSFQQATEKMQKFSDVFAKEELIETSMPGI